MNHIRFYYIIFGDWSRFLSGDLSLLVCLIKPVWFDGAKLRLYLLSVLWVFAAANGLLRPLSYAFNYWGCYPIELIKLILGLPAFGLVTFPLLFSNLALSLRWCSASAISLSLIYWCSCTCCRYFWSLIWLFASAIAWRSSFLFVVLNLFSMESRLWCSLSIDFISSNFNRTPDTAICTKLRRRVGTGSSLRLK